MSDVNMYYNFNMYEGCSQSLPKGISILNRWDILVKPHLYNKLSAPSPHPKKAKSCLGNMLILKQINKIYLIGIILNKLTKIYLPYIKIQSKTFCIKFLISLSTALRETSEVQSTTNLKKKNYYKKNTCENSNL